MSRSDHVSPNQERGAQSRETELLRQIVRAQQVRLSQIRKAYAALSPGLETSEKAPESSRAQQTKWSQIIDPLRVLFRQIRGKKHDQKARRSENQLKERLSPVFSELIEAQLVEARIQQRDQWEARSTRRWDPDDQLLNLVAFYWPHFYPAPENAAWWGAGFTEWTHVRRAKPEFAGHNQPRVPGDFGYYDLRDPDVLVRQFELARQYGILGFCIQYYWFGGRRLLERPITLFLEDKSRFPDPFMICWVNENWTRPRDGLEDEILVRQDDSDGCALQWIKDLEPILLDPRYIRIEGKPFVMIYRAGAIPDAKKWFETCRTFWREAGHGELYIAHGRVREDREAGAFGADATVQFPPHGIPLDSAKEEVLPLSGGYKGARFHYDQVALLASAQTAEKRLHRTVFPSWDNSARKPRNGSTVHGSTPHAYGAWLEDACRFAIDADADPRNRYVFINAWNGWSEGAYLEPDQRFGYAYLNATAAALDKLKSPGGLLFVGHDAHRNGAQLNALNQLRTMRDQGVALEIWLLGSGELLADYQEIAPVTILHPSRVDRSTFTSLAKRLRRLGYANACLNTVVSGKILPPLRDAGFKILLQVRELPGILEEYGLGEISRRIASDADRILFTSQYALDRFREYVGLPCPQAVVRHQGYFSRFAETENAEALAALRTAHHIRNDAKVVIMVGYGDRRKGVDLFARVAQLLESRVAPPIQFVWVGELVPEMEEEVRKLRQNSPIENFLSVGKSVDPRLWYQMADLFFLSSREDPFPNVVIEAMAMGVPVVAFQGGGGYVELIERGCGELVPMGEVTAAARAIEELLTVRSGAAKAMGEAGRKLIREEFEWDDFVRDLVKLSDFPA